MKSRKQFAKQVASTISRNHGKNKDASFIFGISGKWGEGKTHFLEVLQVELDDLGEFKIVWINPWKFGDDKISFLRNFLKNVTPANGLKKTFCRFREMINNETILDQLYFDRSFTKIHWGVALLYTLFLIEVLLIYYISVTQIPLIFPRHYLPLLLSTKNIYSSNAYFINVLFVTISLPVILTLAKALITTQSSSKSIVTLDKFDDLVNDALKLENKKLIIFVDDLDRVLPDTARYVLDSLRLFFNKSDISFVVTGDHTVLERYIGQQTHPRSLKNEQIEEGRRYLKKIFNVYWRLPLPTNEDFESVLVELLKRQGRKTVLTKKFEKTGYEVFQNYLRQYFDRNFRAIERFIETTIFTFETVDSQLKFVDKSNKKYLEDILKYPLLLVRVLMIQEFCAPLFEKIMRDNSILDNLEYYSFKKDGSKFDHTVDLITETGDKLLTDQQKQLLRKISFETEGFYNPKTNGLRVSYQPFLYLAADSSFTDLRGTLPKDFVNDLEVGDVERIKSVLTGSAKKRLKEASSAAMEYLTSKLEEPKEFLKTATPLVKALTLIRSDHPSQNIFIDGFGRVNFTESIKDIGVDERIEFYQILWSWFDNLEDINLDSFHKKFPIISAGDFQHIKLPRKKGKYGGFTSRILGQWFFSRYREDGVSVINEISSHIGNIAQNPVASKAFSEELSGLKQDVVDDLFTVPETSRMVFIQIVENFFDDSTKQKVQTRVLDTVKKHDPINTAWAYDNEKETNLWSRVDLEEKLIESIEDVGQPKEVIDLLIFVRDKISQKKIKFWKELTELKENELLEALPKIYTDESLRQIAPNDSVAQGLFDNIIEKVKDQEIEDKNVWLMLLRKDNWMWNKLPKLPSYQKLNGIRRTKNDQVQSEIATIFSSWNE